MSDENIIIVLKVVALAFLVGVWLSVGGKTVDRLWPDPPIQMEVKEVSE